MPLQVNYVGKAANLYEDAGYQLSGSAYVVNKALGTGWLWDRVRVSGGAYGGFSDFDTHSGMFSFLSYRDPNLTKTVRGACAHCRTSLLHSRSHKHTAQPCRTGCLSCCAACSTPSTRTKQEQEDGTRTRANMLRMKGVFSLL
jgi:Zn-dependent M16 (insulinase) family peptidase